MGGEVREGVRWWPDRGAQPIAPTQDLIAALRAGPALLVGGEPCLRADLPDLIHGSAPLLHLRTDGLLLVELLRIPGAAQLAGIEVALPAAHEGAGDWLLGGAGRWRRVVAGLRTVAARRGALSVLAPLLRPSLADLRDRVRLAAALGIKSVAITRVACSDVAADDAVALVPDLDAASEAAEGGVQEAVRLGVRVRVVGLPHCLLGPRAREVVQPPPDGTTSRPRCQRCPGAACPGAPEDHARLFGSASLAAPTLAEARPFDSVRSSHEVRVRWQACGPVGGLNAPHDRAEPEGAAAVRTALIRAVRSRPKRLVLEGLQSLWHPDAADLVRELARLSVERVEVDGDGAALDGWSDGELARLQRVDAVRVYRFAVDDAEHDAIVGVPGHGARSERARRRLEAATGRPVAVLLLRPDGGPA